jgi:hypothetical protein
VDDEDEFLRQLGQTIQSWLWVEAELYALYALVMRGANSHLVSVTFNNIQSVGAKLGLLNSCLALILPKKEAEWLHWRRLFNKADSLNKKRNKIVHEPMVISVAEGRRSVAIAPSHFNALALVKGQTTHKGVVVTSSYKPSGIKVLADHTVDLRGLRALERTFKDFSHELRAFRQRVQPLVASALSAAQNARRELGAT